MDISPFSHPLYVMTKTVGSKCNLRCKYCYYLEKDRTEDIKEDSMSLEMMEEFISQYIGAQTSEHVMFCFHGGEPLLKPVSYYEKVLRLQRNHRGNHIIDNSIQTNGTLLNDEWCHFLKRNGFLVGISIDGPQYIHDEYRKDRNGKGSFEKVVRGVRLLQKHGVEWNAMATVNRSNILSPREFYHFFRDELHCQYLQFTPVVERIKRREDGSVSLASPLDKEAEVAPYSVTAEEWGNFLISIFDEWVRCDVGKVFVQIFDATLACWAGQQPGLCAMAKDCGFQGVITQNGDLYSCDHFVFPEYRLGNIRQSTITEMMYSQKQKDFGACKHRMLPAECESCKYLFACNGECPRNRFAMDENGQPGLNYLCKGYERFFRHVEPYMDYMAKCLERRVAPASIMEYLKTNVFA